mmetsp:Transcript_17833/g.51861  ORF Transcript_17833/g.51861 Transcript_17833/m.51861 type:complete len:418 (+) Transcript_17833:2016-3269(+)
MQRRCFRLAGSSGARRHCTVVAPDGVVHDCLLIFRERLKHLLVLCSGQGEYLALHAGRAARVGHMADAKDEAYLPRAVPRPEGVHHAVLRVDGGRVVAHLDAARRHEHELPASLSRAEDHRLLLDDPLLEERRQPVEEAVSALMEEGALIDRLPVQVRGHLDLQGDGHGVEHVLDAHGEQRRFLEMRTEEGNDVVAQLPRDVRLLHVGLNGLELRALRHHVFVLFHHQRRDLPDAPRVHGQVEHHQRENKYGFGIVGRQHGHTQRREKGDRHVHGDHVPLDEPRERGRSGQVRGIVHLLEAARVQPVPRYGVLVGHLAESVPDASGDVRGEQEHPEVVGEQAVEAILAEGAQPIHVPRHGIAGVRQAEAAQAKDNVDAAPQGDGHRAQGQGAEYVPQAVAGQVVEPNVLGVDDRDGA